MATTDDKQIIVTFVSGLSNAALQIPSSISPTVVIPAGSTEKGLSLIVKALIDGASTDSDNDSDNDSDSDTKMNDTSTSSIPSSFQFLLPPSSPSADSPSLYLPSHPTTLSQLPMLHPLNPNITNHEIPLVLIYLPKVPRKLEEEEDKDKEGKRDWVTALATVKQEPNGIVVVVGRADGSLTIEYNNNININNNENDAPTTANRRSKITACTPDAQGGGVKCVDVNFGFAACGSGDHGVRVHRIDAGGFVVDNGDDDDDDDEEVEAGFMESSVQVVRCFEGGVVAGCYDGSIGVWDIVEEEGETNKRQKTSSIAKAKAKAKSKQTQTQKRNKKLVKRSFPAFNPHKSHPITDLAITPSHLVSSSLDGVIQVTLFSPGSTKPETKHAVPEIVRTIHTMRGVTSLSVKSDENSGSLLIASGHVDGVVRLWDPKVGGGGDKNESESDKEAQSKKCKGEFNQVVRSGQNGGRVDSNKVRSKVVGVEWDPSEGRRYEFCMATLEGRVRVYDVRKAGNPLQSNSVGGEKVLGMCYGNGGVFAGGEGGEVKRFLLNRF